MRSLLIAPALLSVALAAPMMMGNFLVDSGKSVQVTETGNARGGLVALSCVTNRLEVSFKPQIKLPATAAQVVTYRFDNSAMVTERWNIGPFQSTLFLPNNLTKRFLTLGADADSLTVRVIDAGNSARQFSFNVSGFREAIQTLPCSALYGFTPTPVGVPSSRVTKAGAVIDVNMAFISPTEFVKTFSGTFQPEGAVLAWEYNGVKLLLQKGSTSVQSVYDNREITLLRAATEVSSRTVIPASLVSAFSCKVVGVTKASDTTVKIGCGAGQTYEERDLPRY
jgi:hypothetical protein